MVANSMDTDPFAGTSGDFDKQVDVLKGKLAQINMHSDKMDKELLAQVSAMADLDKKFKSAMMLLQQHQADGLHPQIDQLQTAILQHMQSRML